MPRWKEVVHTAASSTEERFDALRYRLKERLGRLGPVQIIPYYGFGTPEAFWLQGRVLQDKGVDRPGDEDSLWRNLLMMYRRFESDEIPGAALRAAYGSTEMRTVADGEGYFTLDLQPDEPVPSDRLWHTVELELLDDVTGVDEPVRATGQVLVPRSGSDFGVISDIDDTVVRTQATNLLKMAQITFLGNARTRLPFEGVAAFYRALQAGPQSDGRNPIFYVSSSPWNLYDLLIHFFELQEIPRGPLLLRDLGLDREKFIQKGHRHHKRAQIERLFDRYPDLTWVLIGDSGQKDPEIYRAVIDRHPSRVQAVYIRDVSRRRRDRAVHALAEEAGAAGVPMRLVADTVQAAEHAANEGLITAEAVDAVREDRDRDVAAPTEAERLVNLSGGEGT